MTIAPPAYPDLFSLGQEAFTKVKREFTSYGLEIDTSVELRQGQGLLCYYDFSDRNIYLSLPDLKGPLGKLQMLAFKEMLCAEGNDELFRFLSIFVPFLIAHELTHHLRHRYGMFGADNWHEEHLANQMASAVHKHRITPAEREFAIRFLRRAVQTLGAQLGIENSAFDSYHDIADALKASKHLSGAEAGAFKVAQSLGSFDGSATMVLRKSDLLGETINRRLDKRRELIANFNQQYAGNPVRYVYYQVGWMYLAMQSSEAHYVNEFARFHLGRKPSYLPIAAPRNVVPSSVLACFKASTALGSVSATLSRYFYKRYRAHLLAYIRQQQHQEAAGDGAAGLDILALWDDNTADPLNFLVGAVGAQDRELFPNRIAQSSALDGLNLPAGLPTPADQALWQQAFGSAEASDTPARRTLELLRKFEQLDLFKALAPEVIIDLGTKFHLVRYAEGETLVWQGEANNDVFVLLQGRLQALVGDDDDAVGTIAPGEVFGELAWLTKSPRAATVRAAQASVCLVIKDKDLQILAFRSPSILQAIGATVARRLKRLL